MTVHEHQWELRHASSIACDLEDCQDKISPLRRHLKRLEATPVTSYLAAVATISGDKPLTRREAPAPPALTSTSNKSAPLNLRLYHLQYQPPPCLQCKLQACLMCHLLQKRKTRTALPGRYHNKVPAGILSFKAKPIWVLTLI